MKKKGTVLQKNPGGARHTSCRHCGLDIEGIAPYRKGEWRDRGNNSTCNDGKNKHAPYIERKFTAEEDAYNRDLKLRMRTKPFRVNPHKRSSKKPISAAQKRARELFVQRVKSGAFKKNPRKLHPRSIRNFRPGGEYNFSRTKMKRVPTRAKRKKQAEHILRVSARMGPVAAKSKAAVRAFARHLGGSTRRRLSAMRKNPRRRIGTPKMFVAFAVAFTNQKFYLHPSPANAPKFDSKKAGALKFRTERTALMVVSKYKRLLMKNRCIAIGAEAA